MYKILADRYYLWGGFEIYFQDSIWSTPAITFHSLGKMNMWQIEFNFLKYRLGIELWKKSAEY